MTETNIKAVSVMGFLLAVCGIVFLLMTRSLFSPYPVSIAVQVGAFILMVWARKTLGMRSFHAGADPTSGSLITGGPYRWWRHPIYAAIIYFVLAGVLPQLSQQSAAAACLVLAGLYVRMILEEQLLRQKYAEYEAYAQRAKRFVPYII